MRFSRARSAVTRARIGPGFGVLRARRDRPDLDEPETERAQPLEVLGVLVEPGGDAERRGEA